MVAVSAAVAQFVVEVLNQLVVVLQLEILVLYHVVQSVYLALQPAPLVDELPQPVVLAPDGVAEHAAKEGQHGHRHSEYTIERQQELFVRTKKLLYDLRYSAKCYLGDGYRGLTEIELRTASRIAVEGREDVNHNIFDRVIITCGAPYVPEPLMRQLKVGGLMVIPVEGEGEQLQMLRISKEGEERESWKVERFGDYQFVPMLGGLQF